MKPNEHVYPSYSTSKVINSFINPYDEFSHFCVDNYYRNGYSNELTLTEFKKYTIDKKKSIFVDSLSNYYSGIEIVDVGDLIEIYSGPKFICKIQMDDISGVCDDNTYTSLLFDFVNNDDFTYISDKNNNQYFFYELMNNKEQLDLVISLIIGLLNFGDFMKYHKMFNIKLKNIDSFIRSLNPYINNELEVVYDNNGFKLYIDLNDTIHFYESDYKSYMNSIDTYFSNLNV